jgi:hypothetical protein
MKVLWAAISICSQTACTTKFIVARVRGEIYASCVISATGWHGNVLDSGTWMKESWSRINVSALDIVVFSPAIAGLC